MKKINLFKRLFSLATALLLTVILVFNFSIPSFAKTTSVSLDNNIDNWSTTSAYSSAINIVGGVEFIANTAVFGEKANFSQSLDVSEEVIFDLKFSSENIGPGGFIGITFGQDSDSFDNSGKGATYVIYKTAGAAIQCNKDPLEIWRDFPFNQVNSFKFVKGISAWELYLKNSIITSYALIGTISYDIVSSSIFTDDKAVLSLMIYDGLDRNVTYSVTNFTNKITTVDPVTTGYINLQNTPLSWQTTNSYANVSTVNGGVSFAGGTAYGQNILFNNEIDVSKSAKFDMKFTQQTLGIGNSWIGITFGKDGSSFDDPAKGATYMLYKKADAAIQSDKDIISRWLDFPYSQVNSFEFVKGAAAWELYLKNPIITSYVLIGSISFTTVSADVFSNGKAKLNIWVYDNAASAVNYEITNIAHYSTIPLITGNANLISTSLNWSATNSYTNISNINGGVAFEGGTAYGQNISYNNEIDVSNSAKFDMKFTEQTLAGIGNSWIGITFRKDGSSFDDPAKGATFMLYKMADAAIQSDKDVVTRWLDFPFNQINSFEFKKSATAWELYMKNSSITTNTLIGSIPFTTVPDNIFINNKATLNIWIYDSAASPISYEITSLSHYTSLQAVNFYSYNVSDLKILSGISQNMIKASFLQGVAIPNGYSYRFLNKDRVVLTDVENIGTEAVFEVNTGVEILNYSFLLKGDVNGDGTIGISDLGMIKANLLKINPLNGLYQKAGDVNCDNTISISDLIAVKKQAIGLTNIVQ